MRSKKKLRSDYSAAIDMATQVLAASPSRAKTTEVTYLGEKRGYRYYITPIIMAVPEQDKKLPQTRQKHAFLIPPLLPPGDEEVSEESQEILANIRQSLRSARAVGLVQIELKGTTGKMNIPVISYKPHQLIPPTRPPSPAIPPILPESQEQDTENTGAKA